MNSHFINDYSSLIADLKAYLLQEYAPGEDIIAESDSYRYFKDQALQARAKQIGPSFTLQPPKASLVSMAPTEKTKAIAKPDPKQVTPNNLISSQEIQISFSEKTKSQNQLAVKPRPIDDVKASTTGTLKRELPEPAQKPDLTDLHKLWQKEFPQHPLSSAPSDDAARAIMQRWQTLSSYPDISLLFFSDNPKEITFLENVAAAISQYFAPAGLVAAKKIEIQEGWQGFLNAKNLKLVIAHHNSLYSLPYLHPHYCEDTMRGNHTLGRVPLLLLSDLSLYMQEPKLKISLWQSLCQRLTVIKK